MTYLKHYGVKKSQWSPQARAKYDAEHRRKYGDNTGSNIGYTGDNNWVSRNNGSLASRVSERVKSDNKEYLSLSPEQKQRAKGLMVARKKAQTSWKIFGKGPAKWASKRHGKKTSNTEALNKFAKEIKKFDEREAARKAKPKEKVVIGAGKNGETGYQLMRAAVRKSTLGQLSSTSRGKGKSTGGKIAGPTNEQSIKSGLPTAGFIKKRPQAQKIGSTLARKAKLHKVQKSIDSGVKNLKSNIDNIGKNLSNISPFKKKVVDPKTNKDIEYNKKVDKYRRAKKKYELISGYKVVDFASDLKLNKDDSALKKTAKKVWNGDLDGYIKKYGSTRNAIEARKEMREYKRDQRKRKRENKKREIK